MFYTYIKINIFNNDIFIIILKKKIWNLIINRKIIYDQCDNDNNILFIKYGIKYIEIDIFNYILLNNFSLIYKIMNKDILAKIILEKCIEIAKYKKKKINNILSLTKLNTAITSSLLSS